MLKILKKEGFASIVEVIVASIIFLVTAFGIFAAISMLRPQGTTSIKRLEAVLAGKRVIDEIRADVYGNLWASGSPLDTGTLYTQTIGSVTVNYYTADVPNLPLRKLYMNVSYPD
ncbi:MAG TPA: hypothetical protein VI749_06405 [Candidatus Omnitrophota bacterium]|nr:hypothetical protein [Candidatus Omnitrophota bacterium]